MGTHLVLHFVALLLPNQRYAVKGEDNAARTINTLYQEFNVGRFLLLIALKIPFFDIRVTEVSLTFSKL